MARLRCAGQGVGWGWSTGTQQRGGNKIKLALLGAGPAREARVARVGAERFGVLLRHCNASRDSCNENMHSNKKPGVRVVRVPCRPTAAPGRAGGDGSGAGSGSAEARARNSAQGGGEEGAHAQTVRGGEPGDSHRSRLDLLAAAVMFQLYMSMSSAMYSELSALVTTATPLSTSHFIATCAALFL